VPNPPFTLLDQSDFCSQNWVFVQDADPVTQINRRPNSPQRIVLVRLRAAWIAGSRLSASMILRAPGFRRRRSKRQT